MRRAGTVRLGIVRNLITHARPEHELLAVSKFNAQLAFDAKQNVPFRTPVISKISRRVFDYANPNITEVPGTPISCAGFTIVRCRLNPGPISGLEWKLIHLHA